MPYRTATLACLALLLLPTVSATQGSTQEDISSAKLRIGWDEFKKLYDARKVHVVDVRSEAAYEAGHIPGAASIPHERIEEQAGTLEKVKRPIVLYCA